MEKISVAIRMKPTSNGTTQWKVVDKTISLQNEGGAFIKGQTYTFDKIFGTSTRNSEIYQHAKDLVLSALSGFNGTVLAYGQTSSGKTYTMQGTASDPGVIRLAIQDIFTNIDKIDDREFLVRVSYMEIYNEEINDLLAPENRKLQIYESIERGTFVAGLSEEIADSVEQVTAVLERGEAQRQFAETDMNLNSSRSHTIFRMVIESRDKSHDYKQDIDPSSQDAVRVSTLNLVDLAGSERFSKSGAEGARSKEGVHINKSLTTLGMVINKLSEGGGKHGSHIPYRDCRLTRILQSALGGNARTAIICTINADEIHSDETRSTLQFASRAKRVTNCAQVNEILTDAALLKRQKEEIIELRRRLKGSPHTEDLKKEILHLRNDLLKYELAQEFADDSYENNCGNTDVRSTNVDSGLSYASSEFENTLESMQGHRPLFLSSSSETSMLQQQLNEKTFRCQELRPSMEFEIQEKTKEQIATANIALLEDVLRLQNQEIKKLLGNIEVMELELKNCHLENRLLRTKTVDLREQRLRVSEALEQGNQEMAFLDEKTENFKQNLCRLEMKIQGDHCQRFSEAPCLEDDFAHDELGGNGISDTCTPFQSSTSTSTNIRRSSMQYGQLCIDNTLRKSVSEEKGTRFSEIIMHETRERQIFDDKSSLGFQMHSEENFQNWYELRSRLAPENVAHSDDTLAAFRRWFCRCDQGAVPAAKMKEFSITESTVPEETKNLKSSVHLAMRLGNELLQVLHSIENHNVGCLEGYATSKGTVGRNLEALQVLLLENAHVGLRLFSNLSSKESSLASTKLQQLIQEVANFGSGDMEISLRVIYAKIATICANIKEFETKAVKLYQKTTQVDRHISGGRKPEEHGRYLLTPARSEIDPDDTQLGLRESVNSLHSTHNAAMRQGINGWSVGSVAVRDLVGQCSTCYESLDDASLLASQDPGEDICNIDLHQACDEEPGVVLRSHNVTLDMQMPEKPWSTSEMNQEFLLKLQVDEHLAEELQIMGNMSEAEKHFTKEMLHKVKALEIGLTVAEMEIIEYKVENEHLKMNNLRTSLDASLHCDDWELQNLRVECEIQKEEIRQLMEQVMTPDHELERESLLRQTMERNSFLENYLREAEIKLIRAKGWLEELLQLRDAEIQREVSCHDDIQARNAVLDREGVLLVREMSEARLSAISKYGDSRERLNEILKSDTLNEPAARKFQKNRTSSATLSKKLQTLPASNQDEMERPQGPDCRPPRSALREAQSNLLQPCTTNDWEGCTWVNPGTKMKQVSNPSEKENQQCPRFLSAASH